MRGKRSHGGIGDTETTPEITSYSNPSKSLHVRHACLPPPPHAPFELAHTLNIGLNIAQGQQRILIGKEGEKTQVMADKSEEKPQGEDVIIQ